MDVTFSLCSIYYLAETTPGKNVKNSYLIFSFCFILMCSNENKVNLHLCAVITPFSLLSDSFYSCVFYLGLHKK